MRIRITGTRLPKSALGGECPEGQVKDMFGNCVPENQSNMTWATVTSNPFTPALKNTVVNPDGTKTTTGNTGPENIMYATDPQQNPVFEGVSTDQTSKPTFNQKLGKISEGLNKVGNRMMNQFTNPYSALNISNLAVGVTDFIDQKNKQKDQRSQGWMNSMSDNLNPMVSTDGSRGDWVDSGTMHGMFRPDQMGFKSGYGQYGKKFYGAAQYGMNIGDVIDTQGLNPIQTASEITPDSILPSMQAAQESMIEQPAESIMMEPEPVLREPVKSKGVSKVGNNPISTWEDISSAYTGVKNLGIWGDKKHQARKSDHNTGNALDIGITDLSQGKSISEKLVKEASDRNIKYIIFNNKIWNPSVSDAWRPYNGPDPHDGHLHVSFNAGGGGGDQLKGKAAKNNNPGNIHYSDFSRKYGANKGGYDNGGYLAEFPDVNTGMKAFENLLFGPDYSNLTIEEARNKWVNGSKSQPTKSSQDIINNMGGNKRLSQLNPQERKKLMAQFAKWEDHDYYDYLRSNKYFRDGGVYEVDERELMDILSAGGQVEFID